MAATGSGDNASNTAPEKIWCIIGDLQYGTGKTDAELDQRAGYILAHPEIFKATYKRKEYEYYELKLVINTQDIMHALDNSERTAQRLLQTARKKLKKAKNQYVTIKEFCYLNKLDEVTIRKKIVRPK